MGDPVGLGLVQSLARPGGNITGLTTFIPEGFTAKMVELLWEIVPTASKIAMRWWVLPTNLNQMTKEAIAAAGARGWMLDCGDSVRLTDAGRDLVRQG